MASLWSKIKDFFGPEAVKGAASGAAAGSLFGPPGIAIGGGLGGLLGGVGAVKGKKLNKKEKNALKKFQKTEKRHEKKNIAAQKAYNQAYFGGPYGEETYNKALSQYQKKYGGEAFKKFPALSKGQQKLLKQLEKQGGKGLKNLRTPQDFKAVGKEKLGKAGQSRLEDLLQYPSLSNIENQRGYAQGLGRLENLAGGPSISDIQRAPLYQAAERNAMDLFSDTPASYQRFAAPVLRQFQEQIVPQLQAQYGGKGNQFNRALGKSATDLQTNLASLLAGEQEKARNYAITHGQAPQAGQQAQANIYGNAAQSLLPYSQQPITNESEQANIYGKAANIAPSYLDLILKQQGLQAENIYKQNEQATGLAKLGLGVNPYHVNYRAPSFQGGIVTGGAKPVLYGAGSQPQFPIQQPSAISQFGSNFFQPALQAAGQGVGEKIASGSFGDFFGGGGNISPQQKAWGFNQMNP